MLRKWLAIGCAMLASAAAGAEQPVGAAGEEATMGKVTGIGGIFFKVEDPAALREWYREHLGVGGTAPFTSTEESGAVDFHWVELTEPRRPAHTVWGPFRSTTDYFRPSDKPYMFNFRVDDLDAVLARLAAGGVEVLPEREEAEYGRFAWIVDPAGHKVELWQPPADDSTATAERVAREAIERLLHRRDVEASRAGDFATLRTLMSDDAVVLAPGQAPRRGRAELDASSRTMEESFRNAEVLDYRMDFEEVLVFGDHAVEWGTLEGSMRRGDGEPLSYRYHLMRVLRQQPDGEWQVHRTIWNEAPPVPTAGTDE